MRMLSLSLSQSAVLSNRLLNVSIDLFSIIYFLVHVRKPNTTRSVMTTDHEITKKQVTHDQSWNFIDENKSVRPYFLIRPQTVLMVPNETGNFADIKSIERMKLIDSFSKI